MNKICFVIGSLDMGGAEHHLVQILPRLKALGWEPTVYCLSREGTQAPQLRTAGIAVHSGNQRHKKSSIPGARGLGLLRAAVGLFRLLAQERPEIVHFFLPAAYLIGGLISLTCRVPIRIMSRRSLSLYKRHRPIAFLEPLLHRRMTAILGNSRAVIHELVEEGCPPDRLGLIYNGVAPVSPLTPGEKKTLIAALGLQNCEFTTVIVANLLSYKGHSDLLRAFHLISAKLPKPWALLLVGRDDGEGPQLREEASRLSIKGKVHFLGARSDVRALMQIADVGVLSSHQEGFSNAILEGMASGLPMVVTDVGGNPEAVIDGSTGFVVPSRNPTALADALLKLAMSKDMRVTQGARARTRAESEFSLDHCVRSYDQLYRGLLNGLKVSEIEDVGIRV